MTIKKDNTMLTVYTAVQLTARELGRVHLPTTITRMDAGVEPPWMVSRRVVGGCTRLISLTVNGTAVTIIYF